MRRQHALELLTHGKPELHARFGVTRLALFSSTARDAARSDSDVDVPVGFDGPATSQRYFGGGLDPAGFVASALVCDAALRNHRTDG